MKCDSKVRCLFVIIEVSDANVCEDTAQDVRFDSTLTVLCFDLRKQHDTGRVAVFVLCGEQVVHFDIVAVFVARVNQRLKKLKVIDAAQWVAVHIVFFVGALKLVEREGLNFRFVEVKQFVFEGCFSYHCVSCFVTVRLFVRTVGLMFLFIC